MIKRIAFFLVLTAVATLGVWMIVREYYPFVLASEETLTAEFFSEAQSAEFRDAAYKSDIIVFGILGLTIATLAGGASQPAVSLGKRMLGSASGLVLGLLAGVGAACLGYWFDSHVQFPRDPMLYWVGRWSLMLLPIAIASGFAASIAGDFRKDLAESLVGAIMGAATATIIYCLLSGVVAPIEHHVQVFPGFTGNRLLIISLSTMLIGGGILVQLTRKSRRTAGPESAESPPAN